MQYQLFIPLDARGKLNVHKSFRRCPRRFLDVLCKSHLQPMCLSYESPTYDQRSQGYIQMKQSIREWNKENLWNTQPLKKLK